MKRFIALMLSLTFLLTSCGALDSIETPNVVIGMSMSEDDLIRINGQNLKVAEGRLILAAQKQATEKIYNDTIWTVKSDDGKEYQEAVLYSIKEFLARLLCMSVMAEENGVNLNSRETALIRSCTEEYLKQADPKILSELAITEEIVENAFTHYYLYQTLVSIMTEDMDTEISYDDARVGKGYVIFLKKTGESRKEELKAIKKVMKKSENFLTDAEEYNEGGEIERQIKRGSFPKEAEDAFFALEEGQVSDFITTEEGYYMFYCVADYDADATKENRNEMIKKMREESFNEKYDAFIKTLSVEVNDSAWEGFTIADIPVTGADFFDIYDFEMDKK